MGDRMAAVRHRVALRTAENRWWAPGLTAPEVAALSTLHGVDRPTVAHRERLPKATRGVPLTPIVNHGRWIIRCPYCPAAMLASKQDRRFLCGECGNTAGGGDWLPVVWPADADQIEAVLSARPGKENRNWTPPETVATLELENTARGIR